MAARPVVRYVGGDRNHNEYSVTSSTGTAYVTVEHMSERAPNAAPVLDCMDCETDNCGHCGAVQAYLAERAR